MICSFSRPVPRPTAGRTAWRSSRSHFWAHSKEEPPSVHDLAQPSVLAQPQLGITSPWRFQGRILESSANSTDLYDFQARSYDPSLGEFTSFDSVGGSAQNPLTLNRFLYADADPATLVDPDGHFAGDYDDERGLVIQTADVNAFTGFTTGRHRSMQSAKSWWDSSLMVDTATVNAATGFTTGTHQTIDTKKAARARGGAGPSANPGSGLLIPTWYGQCDMSKAIWDTSGCTFQNTVHDGPVIIAAAGGVAGCVWLFDACAAAVGKVLGLGNDDTEDAAKAPAGAGNPVPAGAANVGAARAQQVADLVGGKVANQPITVPGVGSTDIDVIAGDGSLVEVGGPAKALDLSGFGTQLKVLSAYGQSIGQPVKFYYAPGTPESVLKVAAKWLGSDNVVPIP